MRTIWRDGVGGVSRPSRHLPVALGFSAAAAQSEALIAKMSAASDAICQGFSLTYSVALTPAGPPSGNAQSWSGMLIFECGAGSGQLLVLSVPGIRPGLILPSGVDLDISAPALAGLIARVIAAGWTNPDGLAATALVAAIVEFAP